MCAHCLGQPDIDTSLPHANVKQEVKHEVKQEVKHEGKSEVKAEVKEEADQLDTTPEAPEVLPHATRPKLEQVEQDDKKKASTFTTFSLFQIRWDHKSRLNF